MLVSVPNFGHWYPRGRVAVGRFDYDQRGPLDRGHVRFFTRTHDRAAGRRSAGCGSSSARTVGTPFDVVAAAASTSARPALVARRRRGRPGRVRAWPTLFGYQFLYRLERA